MDHLFGLNLDWRHWLDPMVLAKHLTFPAYWATPATHPDEWAAFGQYACADVASMRDALAVMEPYAPLPSRECLLWRIDYAINDRGLPVDHAYVERASAMMDASDAETLITLGRVTGCNNPNSVAQLKAWLAAQGCPMSSVAAGAVVEALDGELPDDVRRVLLARQQLAARGQKSSPRSRRRPVSTAFSGTSSFFAALAQAVGPAGVFRSKICRAGRR